MEPICLILTHKQYVNECPGTVSYEMIAAHAKQVEENHSCSVDVLSLRGITVTQAVAILEDRMYTDMDDLVAQERFVHLTK